MCLYVHMVYPSPTKETRFVNVQSPKHLFSWFDLLVKLLPTKSRMESWMEPCKNKKKTKNKKKPKKKNMNFQTN
jgi:hypothetical protein